MIVHSILAREPFYSPNPQPPDRRGQQGHSPLADVNGGDVLGPQGHKLRLIGTDVQRLLPPKTLTCYMVISDADRKHLCLLFGFQ